MFEYCKLLLLKYFLIDNNLFCNFCSINGLESTSNKRYEPPCKSSPRLIFLSIKLKSLSKKLPTVIKDIAKIKK